MNPLLDYFWPIAAFALPLGVIFGTLWFRRERRAFVVTGVALAVAGAIAWHGPFGAADRFVDRIEPTARAVLVDWEVPRVQARLHHGPLTRRLMLSGPADNFQRRELVRMMGSMPGVSRGTWSNRSGVPLIVEAALVSMIGFLLGLLLAYLFELHRRHNAQWKW